MRELIGRPELWLLLLMVLALGEMDWLSVARYRAYMAQMFDCSMSGTPGLWLSFTGGWGAVA